MAEIRSQTKDRDDIKKPPGFEPEFNIVLSVSANDDDCASLEHTLKSSWTVIRTATVVSALSLLKEIPIPIVIGDCDALSFTWGELLDRISILPDPPLLIVTSRLADERLWAEALNLGAWDVLAKPFEADEVIRIVTIACQHWQDRHGVSISRTKQRKPADETKYTTATGT